MPKPMIEYDRWYFLDVFDKRADAVAEARQRRKTDEPGLWVYRIRKSQHSNRWTLEKSRRMSDSDMSRVRHFNRRIREDNSGQRRMNI